MSPSLRDHAAALAPAGIGNIGPGLDVLGMAVTGPGDRVRVERRAAAGIEVADAGHPELPTDPTANTASIAASQVLRRASASDVGLRLFVTKGLPLAGGQGGSAASAVAGAVATNRLLGSPLTDVELLECALEAEATVSGRHADNLAPALYGGICLVRSVAPMDIVPLPIPDGLHVVLAHPDQRMKTAEARAALPRFIARDTTIHQMAQVAAMVGPGAAGTAYIPGLADFVPMVKNIGSMALAGPPLVKAVTGQEIGEQELGDERDRAQRVPQVVHEHRDLIAPVRLEHAPQPVHLERAAHPRAELVTDSTYSLCRGRRSGFRRHAATRSRSGKNPPAPWIFARVEPRVDPR